MFIGVVTGGADISGGSRSDGRRSRGGLGGGSGNQSQGHRGPGLGEQLPGPRPGETPAPRLHGGVVVASPEEGTRGLASGLSLAPKLLLPRRASPWPRSRGTR
ncbi:hypothetical protein GUJ93_ZPchr0013g36746 [Zizania palustris]|uniref:Uncharacterized protein n=1 Tax=Zizania palustris TaxID=103762 RepID=A0A8J5X9J0_ZIZPA|nr:hypothetical protein GUJ93_ZPchr0013g36746 [Zizania palustris]